MVTEYFGGELEVAKIEDDEVTKWRKTAVAALSDEMALKKNTLVAFLASVGDRFVASVSVDEGHAVKSAAVAHVQFTRDADKADGKKRDVANSYIGASVAMGVVALMATLVSTTATVAFAGLAAASMVATVFAIRRLGAQVVRRPSRDELVDFERLGDDEHIPGVTRVDMLAFGEKGLCFVVRPRSADIPQPGGRPIYVPYSEVVSTDAVYNPDEFVIEYGDDTATSALALRHPKTEGVDRLRAGDADNAVACVREIVALTKS